MPPFGRRSTDLVADNSDSTAPASQGPFDFATLEFSEILVPQDGSPIQLRHIANGARTLGPIDPNGRSSVETLQTAVFEAFKIRDESNIIARFLTHEGLRLRVILVETTKGGLYVCRRVRQMPALTSIEGIADPIRTHLSMLGSAQQSGIVIISGSPNSGKTTTALAIILQLTKASQDIAVVVESMQEVRLSSIIQGSQGRIVQIRAVTDPALYDNHLRSLLTLSPRFALVESITSALDVRLTLDLAMAGVLVVTTINANDILGAIGNFINRVSPSIGVETARDAVASTLRGVLHQTLGDRDSSVDSNMHKLNVTTLFLPGLNVNHAMKWKIRDDKLHDLTPDIILQNSRIRGNQTPLEERELTQEHKEV